ncbi:hypothetical protein MMPV_003707 [Pyropia vietnamensis]
MDAYMLRRRTTRKGGGARLSRQLLQLPLHRPAAAADAATPVDAAMAAWVLLAFAPVVNGGGGRPINVKHPLRTGNGFAGYHPLLALHLDLPAPTDSETPMDVDAAAEGAAAVAAAAAAAATTRQDSMAPATAPVAASSAAASAAAAILAAIPSSPSMEAGSLDDDPDDSEDGRGSTPPPELDLAASTRGATGRAARPAEAADRQPVDAGVGVEGALNVIAASRRGDADGGSVLRLEDMLPPQAPRRGIFAASDAAEAASAFADATHAAVAATAAMGLSGSATKDLRKKLSSAASKQALAPPMSAPAAGRVERSAAYAAAATAVSDWQPMVEANRAARTLTFPLRKARVRESAAESTAVLARRELKTPAVGEMEAEINALLASSGVVGSGPGGVGSAADVGGNVAIPADDAALGDATLTMTKAISRRDELAKMRSSLFHYERKMKRMKKIKSRRYRRALKREKEAAAGGLGDDSEEDSDARRDAAERAERRRVEERMSLRHKNTSKWVRRQLQRKEGAHSESVRAAIDEQLRIERELRHKQANTVSLGRSVGRAAGARGGGRNSDGESSSGSSSGDESGDAAEEAALGAAIRGGGGGLLGLGFMQAAIKRRAEAARMLLEEIERDERGKGSDASEDDDEDAREVGRGRPGGVARVAYGGGGRKVDAGGGATATAAVLAAGADGILQSDDGDDEDDADGGDSDADAVALRRRLSTAASARNAAASAASDAAAAVAVANAVADTDTAADGVAAAAADDVETAAAPAAATEGRRRTKRGRGDVAAAAGTAAGLPTTPLVDTEGMVAAPAGSTHGRGGRRGGATSPSLVQVPSGPTTKGTPASSAVTAAPVATVSPTPAVGRNINPWLVPLRGGHDASEDDGGGDPPRTVTTPPRSPAAACEAGAAAHSRRPTPVVAAPPPHAGGAPSKGPSKRPRDASHSGAAADAAAEEAAARSRMAAVAAAFSGAGGGAASEFAAAKAATIEAELPTAATAAALPTTLPGWGTWDGIGVRHKRPRTESAFAQAAREKVAAARAAAVAARRDAGNKLSHVIFTEARAHRAATALTVAAVPRKYQSKEEFEAARAAPLAVERLTPTVAARLTAPKIVAPAGTVIAPARFRSSSDRAAVAAAAAAAAAEQENAQKQAATRRPLVSAAWSSVRKARAAKKADGAAVGGRGRPTVGAAIANRSARARARDAARKPLGLQ